MAKRPFGGFKSREECNAYHRAYASRHREIKKTYWRAYSLRNREILKQYHAKYRTEHRESRIQQAKIWRENNPQKAKLSYTNYKKNHCGSVNASNAHRRACRLQATPKWLTKEQIKEMKLFYVNCPEGYHVDHIHPLKGDGFSGLHVPWNLQYLPAQENLRKSNRLEVS